MADYLYYAPIYIDATNVSGVPTDNAVHKSDYETNYQSITGKVDDVSIATTTFLFEKDYHDFKTLVADPITWADVKEVIRNNRYLLYIISNTEL